MSSDKANIELALDLARELQQRAAELQTPAERRQQAELDRMLQTPSDKATLVQLTDQAFRAKSSARIADQFTHILDVQGVPRFFSPLDRAMLRGFQTFGGWLPGVSVPMVKSHMQQETANVILPAEPELLDGHLRQRREQGVRMNVNFLGEAILSEAEAERRMEQYLEGLQSPETEVFSVKISTLYSQMSPLAREHTIATRVRSAGAAVSQRGARVLHARRWHARAEVHLPRHGGVPRPEPHLGGLHAHAVAPRPGEGGRGHRAAGLHPGLRALAARHQ